MFEEAIDVAVKHKRSMENAEKVVAEVMQELDDAIRKWPTWPTDPLHAQAILNEEVGELQQRVLQCCYEPDKSTKEDVLKEAKQTAAMALRFLVSLDTYEYNRCEQHHQ